MLEVDPDLAAGLDPAQAQIAAARAVARVHVVERGYWDAAHYEPSEGKLGLLVVAGLIARTLTIADRSSTELIGSGDLLRPWQRDGEDGILPFSARWKVLERTQLAALDGRFATAVAPWPQIGAELVGRSMRRARWQGIFATISHLTRVDHRLLLLFWHFAERWGRVRPDGIVVRLPLTHETLGGLIGARRPSVTSALSVLADQGLILPGDRGEWLLTAAARERVEGVQRELSSGGSEHSDGPQLAA